MKTSIFRDAYLETESLPVVTIILFSLSFFSLYTFVTWKLEYEDITTHTSKIPLDELY